MYTHLKVHSNYSLLQSPLTISKLVAGAKDRGFSAIALTDVNVVYGLVEFYRQAVAAGIKPLLGMHLKLADHELVVIALSTPGYHQLLKLSSQIMLAQSPITLNELLPLTGLAAILLPDSPFGQAVLSGDQELASQFVSQVRAKKPASLYVGIPHDEQATILQAFATGAGVEPIALSSVDYFDPDDAFVQKVLVAIDRGETLNTRDPRLNDPGEAWLVPMEQTQNEFVAAGFERAVENVAHLITEADVTITFKQPQLPKFPTPDREDATSYLSALAQQGLSRRFERHRVPDEYQTRLAYELDVIVKMGFADYFLVVWDVMNYAHEHGIMTGAGRGSAAGSLVSYALAITEVDPIAYALLFERFLNPARAQMPDIDLDIPDNRRAEVIQYVHDKYGRNHMAQIITFGTFGAKQAIRDVARVFGLSQFESNTWSKAIPNSLHTTLDGAFEQSQPLKNLIADSALNRQLFQTAKALEGLPRHYSTHAAGIVLSDEPLTDTVALQTSSDGLEQTQVPKDDVEALGLLKMDFLGLRNLSILASATTLVQRDGHPEFDPKKIPLDDPDTLRLFARGDTNGVFQFESAGIKNVLRQLRPTQFEDVVAVNALYRPGPMENIDTFVARKNHLEPISYPDEALAPILASTYGVLVYQEQVMQVASVMGGFSLGEADLLRRAMSKKKSDVLAREEAKFITGAVKKGFSKETATTVYRYIDRFANYGFNRSHAVAYSMVGFWLAYLKEHTPGAFFTALLNANLNNTAKLRLYVQEARARKVPIAGPDINQSQRAFSLRSGTIRFGLLSIKGTRRDFVEALMTARKSGPFRSLRDCLQRLEQKWLKPQYFEPLILSGAFDQFDANRAQTLANLTELMNSVELAGDDVDLFAVLAPKSVTVAEMPEATRLEREAEMLGVYLTGHPVDKYARLKTFYPITAIGALVPGETATILLFVRHIKRIRTKKGQPMAFVDGQDATGAISVTVFPTVYPALTNVAEESVVLVSGKVENRQDTVQMLVNTIKPAEPLLAALPTEELFIRLETVAPDDLSRLLKMLRTAPGAIPVITVSGEAKATRLLERQYWVDGSPQLLEQLQATFGAGNVILRRGQAAT